MVAKIRRNFCQYRMLWERLNRRESEEKALLEELLRNFCQYRMSTSETVAIYLYLLGSDVGPLGSQGLEGVCQYSWAPMWDLWSVY